MTNTYCGINCDQCYFKDNCKGCVETKGHPFGGNCPLAEVCKYDNSRCHKNEIEDYKIRIINEINDLNIDGMPKVEHLFALVGSFVNLEYNMPNGSKIKLLNDEDIYLGCQLECQRQDKCFGIACNDDIIVISRYGENGIKAELIRYIKRKK